MTLDITKTNMQYMDVPDAERHARFFESKLTKFTLDEIKAAHAELEAHLDEFNRLIDALGHKHDYDGAMCSFRFLPEHWADDEQDLRIDYELLCEAGMPPTWDNHTSRESWPVKSWLKAARGYRRLNARLRPRVS